MVKNIGEIIKSKYDARKRKIENRDVDDQREILNKMITQIENELKMGHKIYDISNEIRLEFSDFIKEYRRVNSCSNFFRYETIKYLDSHRANLKKYCKDFFSEGEILKYIDGNSIGYETSSDLSKNIMPVILSLYLDHQNMIYLNTNVLKDLKDKIKNKTFTDDDIENLEHIINQVLDDVMKNQKRVAKDILKNPVPFFVYVKDNLDSLFKYKKIGQFECIDFVGMNRNPEYTGKKEDDYELFLKKILQVDESAVDYFRMYDFCMEYPNVDKDDKLRIQKEFFTTVVYPMCKNGLAYEYNCNKSVKLISEYMKNNKYFEHLNNQYLAKLKSKNLEALYVDDENVIKLIENMDCSDEIKAEALNLFYFNKLTKIGGDKIRAFYILNKYKCVDPKIDEEKRAEKFNQLRNLSDDKLKGLMAEYDVFAPVFSKYLHENLDLSAYELDGKLDLDGSFERMHNNLLENFSKGYRNAFLKLGNTMDNVTFKHLMQSMEAITNFSEICYITKKRLVSRLVYQLKKDDIKINWGIVKDAQKEAEFSDKVIFGFDIPGFNMPIFVHIDKKDLAEMKLNPNDKYLPVYKRNEDFFGENQRYTTQLVFPLTKKDKANLQSCYDKSIKENNDNQNFLEHIMIMQDKKKIAEFIKNKKEVYNIETDEFEEFEASLEF